LVNQPHVSFRDLEESMRSLGLFIESSDISEEVALALLTQIATLKAAVRWRQLSGLQAEGALLFKSKRFERCVSLPNIVLTDL
jgi:hypothetical protein